MNHKTYYQIVSVIFAVVAVGHALRLVYGWDANIGGVDIPLWVSWFAIAIAGYLSYRGWTFAPRKKGR
jgi:hypothetical protein